MTMLNRIRQLELASRPVGRVHWLSPANDRQTVAEATAAYEVAHGPIDKNDIICSWDEFADEGRSGGDE